MFWNLLLYFSLLFFVCPVLVCDSRKQIHSACLIIQDEKVKRPILHSKCWQILWLRNLIIYVQIHRSASKCKFWHKSPRELVQEWHRRCLTFGNILFPEGWLDLTQKNKLLKNQTQLLSTGKCYWRWRLVRGLQEGLPHVWIQPLYMT